MKKTLIIAIITLFVTGCATTAKHEKALNSWLGATELALVRSWGPPQQSYEVGGKKFLVYVSSRNVHLDGSAPNYRSTRIGNTVYTNKISEYDSQDLTFTCKNTFELDGDRIVGWSYKGNDCKSR